MVSLGLRLALTFLPGPRSYFYIAGRYCIYLCYENPKKETVSHVFKHLIQNFKSYNGVKV